MPDGLWDKWRIYPAGDAERLYLVKKGDVVMHLTRKRLVRVMNDRGSEFYTVRDILSDVQLVVKPSELGSEPYNEMEIIAWAATQ